MWFLIALFLIGKVAASTLSQELCLCPDGCAGMDVISQQRPYEFQYVSQVITAANQYEWMGYISFPYDAVYLSSDTLAISCGSSMLYSSNTFFTFTQVNDYLCVYNTSFQNLFISLRQVSASQQLTIYFDPSQRRNLCGICNCDVTCETNVAIVVGVLGGVVLLGFIILCYRRKAFKKFFSGPFKKYIIKPGKE